MTTSYILRSYNLNFTQRTVYEIVVDAFAAARTSSVLFNCLSILREEMGLTVTDGLGIERVCHRLGSLHHEGKIRKSLLVY